MRANHICNLPVKHPIDQENKKNEKKKAEDYFILFILKIELRHIWPSSRLQGCIVPLLM